MHLLIGDRLPPTPLSDVTVSQVFEGGGGAAGGSWRFFFNLAEQALLDRPDQQQEIDRAGNARGMSGAISYSDTHYTVTHSPQLATLVVKSVVKFSDTQARKRQSWRSQDMDMRFPLLLLKKIFKYVHNGGKLAMKTTNSKIKPNVPIVEAIIQHTQEVSLNGILSRKSWK